MSLLPLPVPVQLGPPGLYSLPKAVGFGGLVLAQGQLPIRLHFALEDETEFHLPTTDNSLERLYTALKAHFGQ